MIISTCSYGSSGSSAVSDYLRECNDTQVLDKLEFNIISCPDGLSDLEYHLCKKNARQSRSITAIQRFQQMIHNKKKSWNKRTGISPEKVEQFTINFLDSITQIKYIGQSPRIYKGGSGLINRHVGSYIIRKIIRPLERRGILKRNINVYPYAPVRFSSHPMNFNLEAKRYIQNILTEMGVDFHKIVVLDQALSGSDPTDGFAFLDDPYAIIVDRDPRDQYIFAKEVLLSIGRFMPTENVHDFITYYRAIRTGKESYISNPRCLFVQFEDMVYEYDRTTETIDQFLHVTNNHRKTVFDPQISMANTNLIRKFPQYSQDISIIEKELPEYLFDFSKYPESDNSGKMFIGKSPLNKG